MCNTGQLYAKSKLVTAWESPEVMKSFNEIKCLNFTGGGQIQASNFAQAADFHCEVWSMTSA